MCGVLHHGKRASMSDCRMGNLLGRYSFQGGIAQWGIWVDSLEACGSTGMVIFLMQKNPCQRAVKLANSFQSKPKRRSGCGTKNKAKKSPVRSGRNKSLTRDET
jgi:hypothetical protein